MKKWHKLSSLAIVVSLASYGIFAQGNETKPNESVCVSPTRYHQLEHRYQQINARYKQLEKKYHALLRAQQHHDKNLPDLGSSYQPNDVNTDDTTLNTLGKKVYHWL